MEIDSGKKPKSKKQTPPTIISKEVLTTFISETSKNNPKLKDEIVEFNKILCRYSLFKW